MVSMAADVDEPAPQLEAPDCIAFVDRCRKSKTEDRDRLATDLSEMVSRWHDSVVRRLTRERTVIPKALRTPPSTPEDHLAFVDRCLGSKEEDGAQLVSDLSMMFFRAYDESARTVSEVTTQMENAKRQAWAALRPDHRPAVLLKLVLIIGGSIAAFMYARWWAAVIIVLLILILLKR